MSKKLTNRQLLILEAAAKGKCEQAYPQLYLCWSLERRPSSAEMDKLRDMKLITLRARPDEGCGWNTETMEITSVKHRVIVTDLGLSMLDPISDEDKQGKWIEQDGKMVRYQKRVRL